MPFVPRAVGGAVGQTRPTGVAPVLPLPLLPPSRGLAFNDAVHETDEVEPGEPPPAADAPDDDRAPPLACESSQGVGGGAEERRCFLRVDPGTLGQAERCACRGRG